MAKYVLGLSLAVFSLKFYTHGSYVTKKVIKSIINPNLWTLSTDFLKYAIGFFILHFKILGLIITIFGKYFHTVVFLLSSRTYWWRKLLPFHYDFELMFFAEVLRPQEIISELFWLYYVKLKWAFPK